jgi:hypothetical protein
MLLILMRIWISGVGRLNGDIALNKPGGLQRSWLSLSKPAGLEWKNVPFVPFDAFDKLRRQLRHQLRDLYLPEEYLSMGISDKYSPSPDWRG